MFEETRCQFDTKLGYVLQNDENIISNLFLLELVP